MNHKSGDILRWKSETVTFIRVVEPANPGDDTVAMNGGTAPTMARVRKENGEIILVPLDELSTGE